VVEFEAQALRRKLPAKMLALRRRGLYSNEGNDKEIGWILCTTDVEYMCIFIGQILYEYAWRVTNVESAHSCVHGASSCSTEKGEVVSKH
jgi:hypothetical protein